MLEHKAEETSPTPLQATHGIRVFRAFQQYREYRYIWSSSLFTLTGVWMQTLVFGWLTYEITGSTFLLALFTAARMTPMLLGPVGGLLADRIDRVKFLVAVQTMMLGVSTAMTVLVMTDQILYWHFLVGGFLLGLGGAPMQPSRISLITDVVRKEDVSNAIAMNTIAFDITRILGPAIGGILMGLIGPANTLWFATSWYVLSIASLGPIFNLGRSTSREPRSLVQDLLDGFRAALSNRMILIVLSVTLSANALAWPVIQAFLPVFAKDILSTGPAGLGFLQMAAGAGALVSAVAIASLGDFQWKGKLFVLGTGGMGVFLAMFALSTSLPLSLTIMFVYGIVSSAFGVMQSTLLMLFAPPEMRGRIMGMMIFVIGVLPVATLVHGAIASLMGVVFASTLAGAILAVHMVLLYVTSPRVRRMG